MAGVVAVGVLAGCGESDSTSGGVADETTPDATASPNATVPTVGSEDTPDSSSGALGGAGPEGGESGPTAPDGGGVPGSGSAGSGAD